MHLTLHTLKIHTGAAVLQKQKQNQNHSQSSPKFGNAIYQMFANVDPKYKRKHCEFRASLNAYYISNIKNKIRNFFFEQKKNHLQMNEKSKN